MGQEQSTAAAEDESGREVTLEELSKELALQFAAKCYTSLELYHFKEVFRRSASTESGLRYWREDTLSKFLELPESLSVDHVVYQMATNLGAFPFPSLAPCILTIEATMKVVTLLTERYTRILKKGKNSRITVLYASLAVFDRRASEKLEAQHEFDKVEVAKQNFMDELSEDLKTLDVESAADDTMPLEDHEDEDELALAALDLLHAPEAHKLTARPKLDHSVIPTDNLLKLLELLLLVAPLTAQESVNTYPERLTEEGVAQVRRTAANIIAAFMVDQKPGVTYRNFASVVPASLPYLFNGLATLFEHFLFGKDIGLPRRRRNMSIGTLLTSPIIPEEGMDGQEQIQSPIDGRERSQSPGSPIASPTLPSPSSPRASMSEAFPGFEAPTPLLERDGEILNKSILTQLSFFIEPSKLFHRLHPLFSGTQHGFSLGSFEKEVFSWQAPTLLLVSGLLIPEKPSNSRERSFADILPPKRFSSSGEPGSRVVFGAYIPVQWHTTHKGPIGNPATILFQLAPVHDVFSASTVSRDWITFNAPPHAQIPGIGFGLPLPMPSPGVPATAPLGPVSLFLDEALEYGAFTHTAAVGSAKTSGGSFTPSQAPVRRGSNWQDRFEVEALEVWGLGGVEQTRQRSRTLEFEEREARLRREGRGSIGGAAGYEADREILKMAGLIGHGEEGGSMVGLGLDRSRKNVNDTTIFTTLKC